MANNDNAVPTVVACDRVEDSVSYLVSGREIVRLRHSDGRAERLTGAERDAVARWILRETGRTSVVTGARAAG